MELKKRRVQVYETSDKRIFQNHELIRATAHQNHLNMEAKKEKMIKKAEEMFEKEKDYVYKEFIEGIDNELHLNTNTDNADECAYAIESFINFLSNLLIIAPEQMHKIWSMIAKEHKGILEFSHKK